MTALATYRPGSVGVYCAGLLIDGLARGRMIEIAADAEEFTDGEGVDGEPIRWQRGNPFARMFLTLHWAARANDVLSNLLNADRLSGASLWPVLVEDRSNRQDAQPTRILAGSGWIPRQPAMAWDSDNAPARRWEIRLLYPVFDIRGVSETPAITL